MNKTMKSEGFQEPDSEESSRGENAWLRLSYEVPYEVNDNSVTLRLVFESVCPKSGFTLVDLDGDNDKKAPPVEGLQRDLEDDVCSENHYALANIDIYLSVEQDGKVIEETLADGDNDDQDERGPSLTFGRAGLQDAQRLVKYVNVRAEDPNVQFQLNLAALRTLDDAIWQFHHGSAERPEGAGALLDRLFVLWPEDALLAEGIEPSAYSPVMVADAVYYPLTLSQLHDLEFIAWERSGDQAEVTVGLLRAWPALDAMITLRQP